MKRNKPLALVAGAALLTLAACGGGGDDSSSSGSGSDREFGAQEGGSKDAERQGPAAEVEGATAGGTVTVYLPGDPGPNSLDPTDGWSVTGNSIQQALTHRSLTQYVRDEEGQPVLVPDLATDLGTPNEDYTEWTFTIRDDATWEDGKPVTAEEVAFGIQRSLDSDTFPSGPGTEYSKHYFLGGEDYTGPYTDKGKRVRRHHRRRPGRHHQDGRPRSRTWTTGAPSWRWARLRSATPPSRRTTARTRCPTVPTRSRTSSPTRSSPSSRTTSGTRTPTRAVTSTSTSGSSSSTRTRRKVDQIMLSDNTDSQTADLHRARLGQVHRGQRRPG